MPEFEFSHCLQVAPMWHISSNQLEKIKIGIRIVQGDLDNPTTAINLLKSVGNLDDFIDSPDVYKKRKDLIDEYWERETTLMQISKKNISIPTSYCRKIPIPFSFVNNLPDSLKIPILDTAFNQFVGRVPPQSVWAKDISIINEITILNMLPEYIRADILKYDGEHYIPLFIRDNITKQCEEFLQQPGSLDNNDPEYENSYILKYENEFFHFEYLEATK